MADIELSSDPSATPQVHELTHPSFVSEMKDEKLVASYTAVKKKPESAFQLFVRVFMFCRWVHPMVTYTLNISDRRVSVVSHEIITETSHRTKVSNEWLQNLEGITTVEGAGEKPLWHKLRPRRFRTKFFIRMYRVFLWLVYAACIASIICGFTTEATFAAIPVTISAALLQPLVFVSVIVVLVHNMKYNQRRVELVRTVLFFGYNFLAWVSAMSCFIFGYAVGHVELISNGFLFLFWNLLTMLLYFTSMSYFPYYAKEKKTKLQLHYSTKNNSRTQTAYFQNNVIPQIRSTIMSLKGDVRSCSLGGVSKYSTIPV